MAPYKISGTLSDDARVIVIEESGWTIESNSSESSGSYEAGTLVSGTKFVVSRKADGEVLVYGAVEATYYAGPRGLIQSDYGVDAIAIATLGSAENWGGLGLPRRAGTSNGANDRGIFGGGWYGGGGSQYRNNITYCTISTNGSAVDFGDMYQPIGVMGACSNNTNGRGIFAGGSPDDAERTNTVSYVTISTTSNSINFGDLTYARAPAGTDNGTGGRGVFAGGAVAQEQ